MLYLEPQELDRNTDFIRLLRSNQNKDIIMKEIDNGNMEVYITDIVNILNGIIENKNNIDTRVLKYIFAVMKLITIIAFDYRYLIKFIKSLLNRVKASLIKLKASKQKSAKSTKFGTEVETALYLVSNDITHTITNSIYLIFIILDDVISESDTEINNQNSSSIIIKNDKNYNKTKDTSSTLNKSGIIKASDTVSCSEKRDSDSSFETDKKNKNDKNDDDDDNTEGTNDFDEDSDSDNWDDWSDEEVSDTFLNDTKEFFNQLLKVFPNVNEENMNKNVNKKRSIYEREDISLKELWCKSVVKYVPVEFIVLLLFYYYYE